MSRQHERPSGLGGVIAGLVLAGLVLLWCSTGTSLSGWSSAKVSNAPGPAGSANTTATGALAFTHAYGGASCAAGPRVSGTTPCAGSIAPTAASASAAVVGTDQITNNGTLGDAQLTADVSAPSCAPVSLADRVNAGNPMLPRYATSFQVPGPTSTTNAVSFTGGPGYASATTQQTLHGGDLTVLGATYGLGVAFRAAAGQSGPLAEFDSSPTSTSGTDDQVLWLNANGTISFLQSATSTSPQARTTTPAATSYANGTWHFVYVRQAVGAVNLSNTTTISVDGTTVATGSGNIAYTNTQGYWHLGWAPVATTGLASAYFAGALSNLVVFQGGNAPAAPTTTQLATQATFNTWATNATDHWLLGDSGTTTYSGTPTYLTAAACTMLTISWTFSNPSATAVSGVTLAAFAAATSPYVVGAEPGPGATQTSTIAISRAAAYDADIAGLRLYVPFSVRVQTASSRWPLVFSWTSSDSVVLG